MPVTMGVKNLDRLAEAFDEGAGSRPTIQMGVKVVGPAAAYAMVWEWGSARLTKPGPKTTWGVNPAGEVVILTLTAPNGYIRIHKPEYRQIIREEMNLIPWNEMGPRQIRKKIAEALAAASQRCAELIAESAPYDTGELEKSIVAITTDDPKALVLDDHLTVRPKLVA
jgi:hypothetical protein